MCFDSGMPSTTSNNSDSACSQAFSSSDMDGQVTTGFYDRSDGEHLVQGRLSTHKILLPDIQQLFINKFNATNSNLPPYTHSGGGTDTHLNLHPNNTGRISSEEESGFSTPTKGHQGKKLVYEVVV